MLNKNILAISFFLLSFYLPICKLNGQVKFDSLGLKVPHEPQWIYDHPFMAWDDHKFFYLDEKTGKVRVYDSSGNFVKNIGAKTESEKRRASSCRRANSIITLDSVIGIVYSTEVLYYSYENKYLYKTNLWNIPFKDQKFSINHDETGPKRVYFDKEDKIYFLPLMIRELPSKRVDTNYYFNYGLVGKFQFSDSHTYKLTKTFSERRKPYKNKLLSYLLDAGLNVNKQKNKVYVWHEASKKIRVYDYDGNLIKTLGKEARHPGSHNQYISATKNEIKRYHRDFFLQGEKKKYYKPRIYRLQTLQYRHVHFAQEEKLFFRIYRPGVYTSDIPNKLSEDKYKEIKKLCQSPLECGPGPDPMMKYLLVQEYKKPTGLQIYNKKGQLLFDEVIAQNFPLTVLGVNKGTVYLEGRYDHSQKKYWIYKAKLSSLLKK